MKRVSGRIAAAKTARAKTHLLNLVLMRRFEHAIARNVISLLTYVLAHAAQEVTVVDPDRLQQGGQVVW